MLHPGDQLHHYIVEAEVGGGGMARVYRVRHGILGHSLALKVLDPYWVKQPNVRKRFLAEGQIQALVRHPAIVAVTDAVVDANRGIAGLVMEYVEGPTLAEFIARRTEPPPADLVRDLMLPVLQGMHHAHQEGVIHRDLKPRNMLLSRDAAGHWYPRVVDFGVAYVSDEVEKRRMISRPERASGLLGTPAFMCPEQIEGDTEPNPRWDVFSLGIVLYELATGRHPFEREDDDATMAAIQKGAFLPPEQVYPGLDPALAAAISQALRSDPVARFESCAEFAEALSGAIDAGEPALDSPPPSSAAVHAMALDPEALLVLPDVPSRQQEWPIRGETTLVGSGARAQVQLTPSGGVEPLHFAIHYSPGGWALEDRSLSGTRVNGARVSRIGLDEGDLIRVGHTVLRFRIPVSDPPEASDDVVLEESITDSLPRFDAWLEVRLDDGRSERIPVTTEGVVIGRDAAASLLVQDIGVSRRHCRIRLQGLDVTIEDLSSANGTFVDGQQVRFRRLRSGDTIQVGSTLVKFFRRH